jgi:cell division protein FtsW (lipid II flippase)
MKFTMELQPTVTSKGSQTASKILDKRRHRELFLFVAIFVGLLCLVPGLVIGGNTVGFSVVLALPVILVITALVVRWPILGFFLILSCALIVDQSPLALLGKGPVIYIFYWPNSVSSIPDRPIGLFMLFILLVLTIHGLLKRQKLFEGGELLIPFLFFFACVIWGIVHGLTTGGNLQIITQEVRSFWYLLLGYLLAYNFVRKKQHLRSVFWIVIFSAGIKALVGVYIVVFVIHGDLADNHEIMSHEESFFWISVLLLIVLFSLHYKYRPQLYTALALLPIILISLVANNRRADYVALLVGILVAWALIFMVKPHKRKFLVVLLLITSVLLGAYVAVFFKSQGGIGSPAHAIVSVFHPDPTEAASNLYRDYEDFDLKYTLKLNPMGLGFGKPFLEPKLLPDLSALDPVYNLIPHNSILWVLMRLGPIGYLALWYLFGMIIVRGVIITRQLKDKYMQLVAIYVVCMVIMEIMVAYADYQLSFYRNVIYIGILAGILMKLPKIDEIDEIDEKKKSIAYELTSPIS